MERRDGDDGLGRQHWSVWDTIGKEFVSWYLILAYLAVMAKILPAPEAA